MGLGVNDAFTTGHWEVLRTSAMYMSHVTKSSTITAPTFAQPRCSSPSSARADTTLP